MFEFIPYYFKNNCATPDRLVAKEWGMFKIFYETNGISWTYYDGELYAGRKPLLHPMIYNAYNFPKQGLDGRLWTEDKIFTFWWCKGDMEFGKKEILEWTEIVARKFKDADFIVPETKNLHVESPGRIDITEYTYMFLGIVSGTPSVIKCDYETFIKGEFELYDCSKLRFFRKETRNHPVFRRPPFITEKQREAKENSQYQRSCEYWTRRIGSMDVAEWHLLMYEE